MSKKTILTKEESKRLAAGLNLIDTENPKETIPKFTKDFEQKVPGAKVIYITETGSVLHGTNSDSSDSDYKGIYIPSLESIILNNYYSVVNIKTNQEDTKNGADDIDMELYSIFTFFEKAGSMESNNIEILFSMFSSKILLETEESRMIKDNKDMFLSSNVEQFIGFAMSMAYRYSEKGDRLREVYELEQYFKENMKGMSKQKIKTTPIRDLTDLEEFVKDKEYLDIVEKEAADKKMALYLQVLNSYYILGAKIGHVYNGVAGRLTSFGKRAEKAKDSDGIDNKAFAHALRAILQSTELLTTKNIVFPLTYAKRLKDMKYSTTMTRKELSDIIEEEYEELIKLKDSDKVILPAKIDSEKLDKLKVEIYKLFMKGQ